jgi:hypothetical protein
MVRLLSLPLLTGLLLLHADNFHHFFIHFIPYTFSGMLAPLDTAQSVIIGHKATALTGDLGINGEQLNELSAVGTDLFVDGGSTGLSLATFH